MTRRHPIRGPLLLIPPLVLGLALALPARPGAAQDKPDPKEPAAGEGDTAPPAPKENPAFAKALSGLAVPPSLVGDDASVSFTFSRKSDRETQDWVWLKQPDRAALSESNEGADGYSIGAGTRGYGKAVHKIEVGPPCSIDMSVLVDYNGADSFFLVTLCEPTPGKGLAVDWGRQLVRKAGKPAKGAGAAARADIRAGRDLTIHVEVKDGEVVATLNGVETLRAKLDEKEAPPGRVGFEIHDARVIVKSISFQGKVSVAWAEKEAKKSGKPKGK